MPYENLPPKQNALVINPIRIEDVISGIAITDENELVASLQLNGQIYYTDPKTMAEIVVMVADMLSEHHSKNKT